MLYVKIKIVNEMKNKKKFKAHIKLQIYKRGQKIFFIALGFILKMLR